jgi:hypothetical protein
MKSRLSIRRSEMGVLACTIGALLVATMATLTRWPMIYVDEPYFVDPAVNLAEGGHLWSDFAFAAKHDDAFHRSRVWPGNCPLYPATLAAWVRAVGLELFVIRTLNVIVFAAGVFLLTTCVLAFAAHNRLFVATALPVLMFSSAAMPMMYRTSRYDALCFFLCAQAIFALGMQSWRLGSCLLAVAGFFMPWAGLPSCLLLAAIGVVGFVIRPELRQGVVLLFGALAVGVLAFTTWLWWYDALDAFREHARAVQGRSANNQLVWQSLLGQVMQSRSATLLLLANVLLATAGVQRKDRDWRVSPAVAGVAVVTVLGLVQSLTSSGRYPWMLDGVLATACIAELGSPVGLGCDRINTFARWVASCAVITSAFMLPAVTAVAGLEWHARDHSRVQAFICQHIAADDEVLTDYSAYFPCRQVTRSVVVDFGAGAGPPGAPVALDYDADRVQALNVVVVRPERKQSMADALPGSWAVVATLPAIETDYLRPKTFMDSLPLRCLGLAYPPSLSVDLTQRVAHDRPYSLVIMRRTPDARRPTR